MSKEIPRLTVVENDAPPAPAVTEQREKIEFNDRPDVMVDTLTQRIAARVEAVRIFRRDAQLLTPYTVTDTGFKGRAVEVLQLQQWTDANLGVELSRHFEIGYWSEKESEVEWTPVNPLTSVKLKGVIRALLKTPKEWATLPAITRLSSVPLYLGDGQLIGTNGYHPELGGVWLHMDGQVEIPAKPTRKDAEKALALLKGVIEEFPFDRGDDGSSTLDHDTALAALMTGAFRSSLDHAPGIAIDGNGYGIGKSALADVINIIHTGRPAAVTAWTANEEENEKRIDAAMLCGRQTVAFDNVAPDKPVEGEALNQLLSQHSREPRPLGSSRKVELPCTQLVLFTGNGLRVVKDNVRRFLYIRLVSLLEDPLRRQFKRPDFYTWVMQHRADILRACFVITAAYELSGERVQTRPLAGFDHWCRYVRDPLVWLGCRDATETTVTMKSEDEDSTAFAAILEAWAVAYGETPVLLKHLTTGPLSGPHGELVDLLREALELRANDTPTARQVADLLRPKKRKVVNGLSLAPVPKANEDSKHKGSQPWKLTAHGRRVPAPGEAKARKF